MVRSLTDDGLEDVRPRTLVHLATTQIESRVSRHWAAGMGHVFGDIHVQAANGRTELELL
jgi:hypothetical protein